MLIKVLFSEAQRLSFWIHEIQRYTISYIWLDETKEAIKHGLMTGYLFGRFHEKAWFWCIFQQNSFFLSKTVKSMTLLQKELMSRANKSLHLSKFCHFTQKIWFSSKFAPKFGFIVKFTKNTKSTLFMFYFDFGLI